MTPSKVTKPLTTRRSTRSTRSNSTRHQSQQDTNDEYTEWGPEINGYRFVGKSTDAKHYKKRHLLVTERPLDDFYNWSYLELPEYKPTDVHDYLEEKGKEPVSGFTYADYHKEWEEIRVQGQRSVIFPVCNVGDALNVENVDKFLNTADDYGRALKVERVRWHPDKMYQTLRIKQDTEDVEDQLLMGKITSTFQTINELWEKYIGKK